MNLVSSIILFVTFAIGIVTMITSLTIQNEIAKSSSECNTSLQRANTGIIVLSTAMLTSTIVLAYSSYACNGTIPSLNDKSKLDDRLMKVYYLFILLLSIVLTTLGAIIKNHAKNQCGNIENKGTLVMVIGIIGMVITLGPFAVKFTYEGGQAVKEKYKKSNA